MFNISLNNSSALRAVVKSYYARSAGHSRASMRFATLAHPCASRPRVTFVTAKVTKATIPCISTPRFARGALCASDQGGVLPHYIPCNGQNAWPSMAMPRNISGLSLVLAAMLGADLRGGKSKAKSTAFNPVGAHRAPEHRQGQYAGHV